MASLEQAALSGNLTSISNPNDRDPDGREPIRDEEELSYPFDALSIYGHSTTDDQFLNSNHTPNVASQTMSRGWSGNTGPKGVLLDFKASHGKSGAILGGHELGLSSSVYYPQVSMTSALASKKTIINNCRSNSPSSSSDSDFGSDRDYDYGRSDPFGSTKTTTRLTTPSFDRHHRINLRSLSSSPNSRSPCNVDSRGKKLFGHLREVGVDNFIQAIEAEKDDKETVVLVHLYDPALESCVILNNHLSNLARVHPRTKFLRALASELDFFSSGTIPTIDPSRVNRNSQQALNIMDEDPFADEINNSQDLRGCKATDTDVLPILIWYRLGEYVESLPAVERLMPRGGIHRGEQGCKDLEALLKKNGIIIHSSA